MAELREWLEARGLGRYADALLAQDIELDILPQLTDADLTAAGLPIGARKRLLQAIEGNWPSDAAASMGSPIVPTTDPATEAERQGVRLERHDRRTTHEYQNNLLTARWFGAPVTYSQHSRRRGGCDCHFAWKQVPPTQRPSMVPAYPRSAWGSLPNTSATNTGLHQVAVDPR
jgi:hypothetical protein